MSPEHFPIETETEVDAIFQAELLERAADIIDEDGLAIGVLVNVFEQDEVGLGRWLPDETMLRTPAKHCALGAIWRAGWERGLLPDDYMSFTDDPYEEIAELAGVDSTQTFAYSDMCGRRGNPELVSSYLRMKAVGKRAGN